MTGVSSSCNSYTQITPPFYNNLHGCNVDQACIGLGLKNRLKTDGDLETIIS